MISENIKIGICMVTYNQEAYVGQAIESVINQNTKYKYKLFIGEDCSTDKTLEVCKSYQIKYPHLIELIVADHNLGLVKNTAWVLNRIKSAGIEYVAMLDGDDYWCDNNKLQLQCDFLEKETDFGLAFTWSRALFNQKLKKINPLEDITGYVSLQKAKYYPLPNNTVFFRTNLLTHVDLNDFIERGFMSCDYAMYVVFAKYTKFKMFPMCTAVTRRGHSSVSHQSSLNKRIKYIDNDIAQFRYLGERFPNEIPFTQEDEKNHRDFMMYSLAVKFCNYHMVKETLHKNKNIKCYKSGNLYRLKIFFSSNYILFNIWCLVSRIYKMVNP